MGDAIWDEYCYITPLGMSAKESIIVGRKERTETFPGGVFAAARHLRNFCKEVTVYSGSPKITKRRFVEETYLRKLFEVHEVDSTGHMPFPKPSEFDVVVVTDFGHGCVTQDIIDRLDTANFLAVNAQTNSANRGFNLITKYHAANYVVLDELEARLAARDREAPLEAIISKLGFPKIIVTQGANGSLGYDGEFHHAPAKARKVVDTMGAGDAFFVLTAPLAAVGASMPELLAIGNAAGAAKCEVVGHRSSVTEEALCRYL